MDFFSTHNILIHIPIGAGGYDLSWIEAVGTIAGLLCIWLASLEKISNYFFGLVNVTLFAIIFFQIQLYASLLLQLFFFAANIYGWYAWSRQTKDNEAELKNTLAAVAKSNGMAGDMCDSYRFDDAIYRSRIRCPDARGRRHYADAGVTGDNACTATGRFPVLGLLHDGAVYRGDDFDDTQICRKLAPVGDNQRNQCGDFCFAGRLCDVAGISDPDIYRRER